MDSEEGEEGEEKGGGGGEEKRRRGGGGGEEERRRRRRRRRRRTRNDNLPEAQKTAMTLNGTVLPEHLPPVESVVMTTIVMETGSTSCSRESVLVMAVSPLFVSGERERERSHGGAAIFFR